MRPAHVNIDYEQFGPLPDLVPGVYYRGGSSSSDEEGIHPALSRMPIANAWQAATRASEQAKLVQKDAWFGTMRDLEIAMCQVGTEREASEDADWMQLYGARHAAGSVHSEGEKTAAQEQQRSHAAVGIQDEQSCEEQHSNSDYASARSKCGTSVSMDEGGSGGGEGTHGRDKGRRPGVYSGPCSHIRSEQGRRAADTVGAGDVRRVATPMRKRCLDDSQHTMQPSQSQAGGASNAGAARSITPRKTNEAPGSSMRAEWRVDDGTATDHGATAGDQEGHEPAPDDKTANPPCTLR